MAWSDWKEHCEKLDFPPPLSEVEFSCEEVCSNFVIPTWVGVRITASYHGKEIWRYIFGVDSAIPENVDYWLSGISEVFADEYAGFLTEDVREKSRKKILEG